MKPCLFLLLLVPAFLPAAPLYSPTWGFYLDLPEGYEMVDGNNVDRYSFEGPLGAKFDIAVYDNKYRDVRQLADDVTNRLENGGSIEVFDYAGKTAVLMELDFQEYTGWGLCLELGGGAAKSGSRSRANRNAPLPLLVALAYAPETEIDMDYFHISALNSFAPSEAERRLPGPLIEVLFPRGKLQKTALAETGLTAMIRENDAEAAQALIDTEFGLMSYYAKSPLWKEAWTRYYRMISRDSYGRIADALSVLARQWNKGKGVDKRAFAEKALGFVQGFIYVRDLEGSDFINLVTGVTEGLGDCDSRAMLWAMLLMQADIPAAMMVSAEYSHAMGLADLSGTGARFEFEGTKWLVAETTATVGIGLISQDMSNYEKWFGILFTFSE